MTEDQWKQVLAEVLIIQAKMEEMSVRLRDLDARLERFEKRLARGAAWPTT